MRCAQFGLLQERLGDSSAFSWFRIWDLFRISSFGFRISEPDRRCPAPSSVGKTQPRREGRVWADQMAVTLPLSRGNRLQSHLILAALLFFAAVTPATALAPVPLRSHPPFAAPLPSTVPLSFQPVTDQAGRFQARARNFLLQLDPGSLQLFLPSGHPARSSTAGPVLWATVEIRMQNTNPRAAPFCGAAASGEINRFFGSDSRHWQRQLASFGRVGYREIYPGIDIAYYGTTESLEYDFLLNPGAKPEQISFSIEGPTGAQLTGAGDLLLTGPGLSCRLLQPAIYQLDDRGRPERVAGGYFRRSRNVFGINLAAYDRRKPLIIDPILVAGTRLGGTDGDFVRSMAIDRQNNIYVVGRTLSSDFPTTPNSPGTRGNPSFSDAVVTKIEAGTGRLIYSTYLGGASEDQGAAIAVDAEGNAYVAGFTASTNFPVTAGAFQTQLSGGRSGDVFVTKLDPTGSSLLYSTYLGGSRGELVTAIAVDAEGHAYLTGQTGSFDFPTTPDSFQPTFAALAANASSSDAFITKLNASGSALEFSTFLGGGTEQGLALALDSSGNAYVAGITSSPNFPVTPGAFQTAPGGGADAFVTKINRSGTALIFSTYLGGGADDFASGIALDASGNCYLCGLTASETFPVIHAFQPTYGGAGPQNAGDGFVAKLNPNGSDLAYASFLGGSGDDLATALALDNTGKLYVVGLTTSTNLPGVKPSQPGPGGLTDAFLVRVTASGESLDYAAYLGGSGDERAQTVALANSGMIVVAGETTSTNFPVNPALLGPSGGSDIFLLQFSAAALLQIETTSGDQVKLRLIADQGSRYGIEASTNLVQWFSWATNNPAQEVTELIDTLDLRYRFYRARLLP